MNSEDHEVIPINNKCIKITNNLLITNKPGSNVSIADNSVDSVNYQQKVYSQYDNTEEIDVKPMFGGKGTYLYMIKFMNKYYEIDSNGPANHNDLIKKVLNNRIFKVDHLLIINHQHIYIIRGNYKNKFKKISD
jgi:hypothetical protein